MLSTVYAQKVLGSDPSIEFAADVLNGPEDPHGAAWVFVYPGMLMGW